MLRRGSTTPPRSACTVISCPSARTVTAASATGMLTKLRQPRIDFFAALDDVCGFVRSTRHSTRIQPSLP